MSRRRAALYPAASLPYAVAPAAHAPGVPTWPDGGTSTEPPAVDGNFWTTSLPLTPNFWGASPTPAEPGALGQPPFSTLDADDLAYALQPYVQPADPGYVTQGAGLPAPAHVDACTMPYVFGAPRLTFPLAPPPAATNSSEATRAPPTSTSSGTTDPLATLAPHDAAPPAWQAPPAGPQRAALGQELGPWGYDAATVGALNAADADGASVNWLAQHAADFHGWGFAPAAVARLTMLQPTTTMTCLLAFTPTLLDVGLDVASIVHLAETGGATSLVHAAAYAPLLAGQGVGHDTFLQLMFAGPSASTLAALSLATPTTRALGCDPDDLVAVALGPNGEAGVLALAECGPELLRRGAPVHQLLATLRLAGGEAKLREIYRAAHVFLRQPATGLGKRKASAERDAGRATQRTG